MNRFMLLILSLSLLTGCRRADQRQSDTSRTEFYSFALTTIDGQQKNLQDYQGKVLLIVNVASQCGFTPQYAGLQKLTETFADSGLVVLGFPANNFRNQEPGADSEIHIFCTFTYGVSFPMFSKISVAGKDIHPLYRFLTEKTTNPEYAGKISWNFTKFLIDRQGRVIARFAPAVKPTSDQVVRAIRTALKADWYSAADKNPEGSIE